MDDSALACLFETARHLPRPQPESVARYSQSLAEVFAKDPKALSDQELHTVVWYVSPDLCDDVNALRYYLPYLMTLYVRGYLVGEELQCRLLQYRRFLTPDERAIITRLAIPRWKANVGADNDIETCFLLFWCDDLSPLADELIQISRREAPPEDVYTERLLELRRDILGSDDPLGTLWRRLYFRLRDQLLEEYRAEKGRSIVAFLRQVAWIA